MKISVLVPIYNVEKFLDQCLKSLQAQTLEDIEFICLDDGSTDRSPEILKKYEGDPRFRIVTKENSGYGDTMNCGLKLAKGDYIGIVEPDDFVDPEMFETLLSMAEKFDADIVRENYFELKNGKSTLHRAVLPEETGRPLNLFEHPHIFYQAPAIWSAIYRRQFLEKNKIGFLPTPGAAFQDTGFNMKSLLLAKNVVFLDSAHLHYRLDNASSSVNSLDKIFTVANEYHEIENFAVKNNVSLELRQVLSAAKFGAYHWNLLRLPASDMGKFITPMRTEFQAAEVSGLLGRSAFPKKWWFSLRLLLKSEKLFALSVRVYKRSK